MPIRKQVRKLSANVRVVTTKSPYGIHSDMVVTDEDILSKLTVAEDETLVKDDQGLFAVRTSYVDSGFTCPARLDENHRTRWDALVAEAGITLGEE